MTKGKLTNHFSHLTPLNFTFQEAAPIILEIAESIAAKAQQWQDEWENQGNLCMSLDDLVEEPEVIDLSKWGQKKAPIDRAPNVNSFPEITKAEAIDIAEETAIERLEVDENVWAWEQAILDYMKNSKVQSHPLEYLIHDLSLTPVQVWLALLLGQRLEMKRSDEDFWGWEGIRVSRPQNH